MHSELVTTIDISGFPGRRRLRPLNRVTQPRRLRPFTSEDQTTLSSPINLVALTTSTTEETPIVPTAPAVTSRDRIRVADLLSQTLVTKDLQNNANNNGGGKDGPTSGDAHFDPNHLLAHVQAVKAVEDSHNEDHKKKILAQAEKVLDDSEESNFIPLSAVPTISAADEAEGTNSNSDAITLINLQKDKSKQNFKSFVDTDLIDSNRSPPLPFIPTRAPPPPTPRPTTTTTASTTLTQSSTTRETSTQSSTFGSSSFSDFRPTFRSTSTRNRVADSTTTTPFVRIPFGPFSTSEIRGSGNKNEDQPPKEEPEQEKKTDKPIVSVSVSTSLSKSSSSSSSSSEAFEPSTTATTSSSSSSSTSKDSAGLISSYDELDRLQSSLDPWARIQQQLKEKENQGKKQTTVVDDTTQEPPTTTTRIRCVLRVDLKYCTMLQKLSKCEVKA